MLKALLTGWLLLVAVEVYRRGCRVRVRRNRRLSPGQRPRRRERGR